MLLWFLLALVVYLAFDIRRHGPVMRFVFIFAHFYFYSSPFLRWLFGVGYFESDKWETNRNDSRLFVNEFIIKWLFGFSLDFGNLDAIHNLKQRQRESVRPLTLAPYVDPILGKRFSVRELDALLVRAWFDELTEGYAIAPPEDKDAVVKAMVWFRINMSRNAGNFFKSMLLFYRNWHILRMLKAYWITLKQEERVIMMVPFFTTIDSTLFNFAASAAPVKEFHELFENVPVIYVPIITKGRLAIVRVVANGANNPGNSVFGPKGLICPGNTVTSMLMKSVADLKDIYNIQIDGKLETAPSIVKRIVNPDSVFVTFQAR